MSKKEPVATPTAEEFEALVEAALKVDPAGLSGKHKGETTTSRPRPKRD